jgi:hypothetical protein
MQIEKKSAKTRSLETKRNKNQSPVPKLKDLIPIMLDQIMPWICLCPRTRQEQLEAQQEHPRLPLRRS